MPEPVPSQEGGVIESIGALSTIALSWLDRFQAERNRTQAVPVSFTETLGGGGVTSMLLIGGLIVGVIFVATR